MGYSTAPIYRTAVRNIEDSGISGEPETSELLANLDVFQAILDQQTRRDPLIRNVFQDLQAETRNGSFIYLLVAGVN